LGDLDGDGYAELILACEWGRSRFSEMTMADSCPDPPVESITINHRRVGASTAVNYQPTDWLVEWSHHRRLGRRRSYGYYRQQLGLNTLIEQRRNTQPSYTTVNSLAYARPH
jgi:hypothetical protein